MLTYRFGLWIVLSFLLGALDAASSTYSVEELCFGKSFVVVDALHYHHSAILTSSASGTSGSCDILLRPTFGFSTVLSIHSYSLTPEEELIIEDSDRFKVQLLGEGLFSDGRKVITSDGSITVHYTWNSTTTYRLDRVKFRFVFTQTHNGPCYRNEFQCQNRRCIMQNLVCNQENNCGDRSDETICWAKPENPVTDSNQFKNYLRYESAWKISVFGITAIIGSVLLGMVLIALAAYFIRRAVLKKKESQNSSPMGVASAPVSPDSAAPTVESRPSYISQIRRSFRSVVSPKVEEIKPEMRASEISQVPSMYPEIHPASAPPLPSNEPKPSYISRIRNSFRSIGNPKVEEKELEEQKSEIYQVPSMYPEVPSEQDGIENPNFKIEK